MNIFETNLLGIVQGLTEFLPVSSSGHLVLFQNMLGFKEPELLLDCSLHLGTLLAVCLYLRSDLRQMASDIWQKDFKAPHASLALWVLVGTLPTAIIGLVFKAPLEGLYSSMSAVGILLVVTGAILIATGSVLAGTKFISKEYGSRTEVGLRAALVIGTAQGLAIMPGISRSGITIVCGLLFGLNRDLAGRFSFLLSIPAIIGAVALQFNVGALSKVGLTPMLFGFGTSALVGFMALKILMGMVRKGQLHYFAPYCWALGLLVVILA